MNQTAFILLQADPGAGGGWSTLMLFGGMFIIMYFLMIRPNMRKQKQEKKYQEELKRGDWVVTTSGIHGKVFELTNDTVVLETGAGKIKFERAAISKELSSARYSAGAEKKD
ncbi:MAG TPA: preprotein translocase subunit YajC [Moheibacter sp.]|nr:preprotein translocase subunit YajC [Moheibacter sp.]